MKIVYNKIVNGSWTTSENLQKGSAVMAEKYVERSSSMTRITRGDIIRVYRPDKASSGTCIQEGTRPMVVISNDVCNSVSPVITALPLTSAMNKVLKAMPTHVIINEDDLTGTGLTKKSVVMAEQICPVDKRDIVMFLGKLPQKYLGSVEKAMRVQIGLA